MDVISHKRHLKLLSYFEPYPFLVVKLDLNLQEPLTLSQESQSHATKGKHRFNVKIDSALLQQCAPDWVESALLRCALFLTRQIQYRYINSQEIKKPLNALRSLHNHLHTKSTSLEVIDNNTTFQNSETNISDLCDTWRKLQEQFFPTRTDLCSYKLHWARRRSIRCLASCMLGASRVSVNPVFKRPDLKHLLEPLLFHEMCHAFLGKPKIKNGRAVYHGKEFRALERQHPLIANLNAWIKNGHWETAARSLDAPLTAPTCLAA